MYGAIGVALFFAIFGYLMATFACQKLPRSVQFRWVICIYPFYWIVLFIVFSINVVLGFSVDPLAFALMRGTGRNYTLGVEWTPPFYSVVFVVLRLLCACIVLSSIYRAMHRRLQHWVDTLWLALTAAIGASFAMLLACYGRFSEVQGMAPRQTDDTCGCARPSDRVDKAAQARAEFDATGTRVNLSTDASLHGFVDSVTYERDGSV